jgi:predicted transcriptional regulator
MGGMKRPMQFRLDTELVARVDAARGSESRTAFLERALGLALDGARVERGVADLHRERVVEAESSKESKPRAESEVERVRSEVARVGRAGGRGAHLPTCRCGLCLAGRREAS